MRAVCSENFLRCMPPTKQKVTSAFGAFLDPVADKLMVRRCSLLWNVLLLLLRRAWHGKGRHTQVLTPAAVLQLQSMVAACCAVSPAIQMPLFPFSSAQVATLMVLLCTRPLPPGLLAGNTWFMPVVTCGALLSLPCGLAGSGRLCVIDRQICKSMVKKAAGPC